MCWRLLCVVLDGGVEMSELVVPELAYYISEEWQRGMLTAAFFCSHIGLWWT